VVFYQKISQQSNTYLTSGVQMKTDKELSQWNSHQGNFPDFLLYWYSGKFQKRFACQYFTNL